MGKLTNIDISNATLTFTIETTLDLSQYSMEVYIDEVCNLKGIQADSPEHNIAIDQQITVNNTTKEVTVFNDEALLPLDWNMKYVTARVFSAASEEEYHFHGVYYVPEIIYDAEIRKLNKHCETCLDDDMMQTLMYVVFKRQLIDYALASDRFIEAMQLYRDICRLLDISLGCEREDYMNTINAIGANNDSTNTKIYTERNTAILAEHNWYTNESGTNTTCTTCANGVCSLN